MIKKNSEQLILDFKDRFHPIDGIKIEVERREIDSQYTLLWFIVKACIPKVKNDENIFISIGGESYTLEKALGELNKNAMSETKPDMTLRRIHVENHPYENMENIVEYRKVR